MVALLLCAALCGAGVPAADAACARNEPGWVWNYEGTLGGRYRVRMSLVFAGDRLDGVYFYATQLRDIRVTGRIESGTRVVLDEQDARGAVVARFTGEFPTRDPSGRFGDSELACEVIVGRWARIGASESLPFHLSMEGGTAGSLGHRYGAIGVRDDEVVHRGAARFWRAVQADDRATVAAQLRYPVTVLLDGRSLRLQNPPQLLARYDAIFTPRFRAAIAAGLPRNMFVRDEGAMLGSGAVWFGADGKVVALNNF
jgi:hypothetical protein